MIEMILVTVFIGSIMLACVGIWGFKPKTSHTSITIKQFPTHTIIHNQGDTPVRITWE